MTDSKVVLAILDYLLALFLYPIPHILWSLVKLFIPKQQKKINGQLALITGGSEGIGRGMAFRFAQEGCNIAIANRNLEKGQQTAEEIRSKYGVKAMAFKCDVACREDVMKMKVEVNKNLGIVDILVNNAGLTPIDNSLLEGDDSFYQYCIDVNMTSWIWTTRAFLTDMIKQRRGHIIGISSASYMCPLPNMVTYVASKYGNKGFMDALRQEMIFFGFDEFIKATTVLPGFVLTNDEFSQMMKEYFVEEILHSQKVDCVADRAVRGILKNEENICTSALHGFIYPYMDFLPEKSKKIIFEKVLKKGRGDDYLNMRLRKCTLLNMDDKNE